MAAVLRYAVRQLLKSPGISLIAVVGLALGIGANVALFSVVNSVLLRPLPYHEPDRLVRLASTNQENNLIRVGFSLSRFLDVQQRQQVFSDLALSIGNAFTLTGRGDPEQLIGLHASAALLPTLGLQPIIGRNFSPDDDRRGGSRVVLISQQMWQQRFNGDGSVLGQALILDGAPYAIIGVLSRTATTGVDMHASAVKSIGSLPAATRRQTMSRSVTTPTRVLSAWLRTIGISPQSLSTIAWATSRSGVSGVQHAGFGVMISLTCI